MARKPRLEVEGGLYHLIARGVDRQAIFHDETDHERFLALLGALKERLPFYLYAYCLMTNHFHLLIERMTDDVGRVMHRLLTGYSQYYNRRYRRTGHLFQGRHKAILCQSDRYMTELVRYIHLNPVRAKMVRKPERYPFSSHRAYLGLEPVGMIDVDPVLRRFGRKRERAREQYAEFVAGGIKLGHQPEFYAPGSGVLGSEEFVDSMIHRVGEFDVHAAAARRKQKNKPAEFDAERLLCAVESVFGIGRDDICGRGKGRQLVAAKDALILVGRRLGAAPPRALRSHRPQYLNHQPPLRRRHKARPRKRPSKIVRSRGAQTVQLEAMKQIVKIGSLKTVS